MVADLVSELLSEASFSHQNFVALDSHGSNYQHFRLPVHLMSDYLRLYIGAVSCLATENDEGDDKRLGFLGCHMSSYL